MAEITLDALLDHLAAALAVRVENRLPAAPPVQFGRLLSVKQAALYLGRSEQAVQHLIHKRQLVVVKKGRRVHLDKNDLDQWIDAAKL